MTHLEVGGGLVGLYIFIIYRTFNNQFIYRTLNNQMGGVFLMELTIIV